jgi:hypothetical protein
LLGCKTSNHNQLIKHYNKKNDDTITSEKNKSETPIIHEFHLEGGGVSKAIWGGGGDGPTDQRTNGDQRGPTRTDGGRWGANGDQRMDKVSYRGALLAF